MNSTKVTTIEEYGVAGSAEDPSESPLSSHQRLVTTSTTTAGVRNPNDDNKEQYGYCCCSCRRRCHNTLQDLLEKDQRLLRAIGLIVLFLNVPFGRYILYPFLIFSTWIHEMCHGIAALIMGGKVSWLNIYANGSGLAYTLLPSTSGRLSLAFVASAGYVGTAMLGGFLLIFRRTHCGPKFGLYGIGLSLLLSCLCWVRTMFGLVILIPMGLLLILCGGCQQKHRHQQSSLSSWDWIVGDMYALIAATCCLNAVTSIQVLFTTTSQEIGGTVRSSDAVVVAEQLMLPSFVWALIWLLLAILSTLIGIVFVIDTDDDSSIYNHQSMTKSTRINEEDRERLQQEVNAPSVEMV